MATFGKKIVGLAAAAVGFAGMAFGQSCTTATATPNYIRAEGTSEQLGSLKVNCTGVAAAGSVALSVTLTPALPVTNKVTSGAIDASAVAMVGNVAGTPATGTVTNGNQISFNVQVPQGDSTIVVSNIRVNATSLGAGANQYPSVSASVFTSGAVFPGPATVTGVLAYAQSGLNAPKVYTDTTLATAGASSFPICNAIPSATPAYVLQVNEGFSSAFKAVANEGSNADHGTRVLVTFGNLPQTGLTIYIPTSVTSGTATLALAKSLTGTFAAADAGTSNPAGVPNGYAAISVSGGAAQVMYQVQADDLGNVDKFSIPVYLSAAANPSNATGTSTVSVSFASDAAAAIPNFTQTSTGAVSAARFNLCTTSLLFPFVTNSSGFDTGVAIANTSADPFSTNGAAAQSGTCTLNFYGASTNPTAVTTASVAAGTVYTNLISGVAAGFQGYMIAQCNFQYAHGFAFITDGFGGGGRGLAQGYLALVIPDTNLTVGGRRTNAAGETLNN